MRDVENRDKPRLAGLADGPAQVHGDLLHNRADLRTSQSFEYAVAD